MCVSSQLSKASAVSGCEQDLPVSKCSDHEVVQPVVSHQKLLFPWVWASGSSGMVQPVGAVPTSRSALAAACGAGQQCHPAPRRLGLGVR